MVQSPSPSPARGGIERQPPKSSWWWEKLVGRRPSKRKPIDVEVVPENLTQEYWDAIDRKTQLLREQQQLKKQQNPWWGPGNWLGRMEHNAKLRNSAQAQKDAADLAAQIEFEVQNPEEMRRRKLNDEIRDARWKALDKEALLKEYDEYVSTGGGFFGVLPPDDWLILRNRERLPDMTVPGEVGKPNTAEENFRLYGPLPLGRLHDPRDANRMGGKSKRILKSKSRSNKGKKTHRSTRSRSTRRRSTRRRSTRSRSTCRR